MYRRFKTFDPQPEVEVRLGESVNLTDKAKLSLYKKSQNSGIPTDILEEVYRRGHSIWDEYFGGTAEQFGFDRVNSFIAGGFAMDLDEDLLDEKRGLWDNIHAKRKRIKAGSGEHMRKPGSKGAPTAADFKASQNESAVQEAKKSEESSEFQSSNSNDPSSRFDGTTSGASVYAKDTPLHGPLPHHKNKNLLAVVKKTVKEALEEDAKGHYSPSGGMTQKGVNAYNRKTGGHLKTAVTTEPSKLKPGSKAANRRKSFCARMGGMKKKLTSSKTANDPDSRINKSLRKWNCEDTSVNELNVPLGTTGKRGNVSTPSVAIRMASGKIEKHPPGKSGSSGGGGGGGGCNE